MTTKGYHRRKKKIADMLDLMGMDMQSWLIEQVNAMTDAQKDWRAPKRSKYVPGIGTDGAEQICVMTIFHLVRLAHFTSEKTKLSLWESWNLVIDLLACHSENPDRHERLKFVKRAYGALAVNQAIQIIQEVRQ